MTALCLAGGDTPFRVGAADTYSHQSSDKVTIGAKPLKSQEDLTAAFGKRADLLRYGVLPVLVVIQNNRSKTLDLRDLEVNLVGQDGRHVSAVNPEDIPFLYKRRQSQVPISVPLPKRGNPLSSPEIVSRAFSAKMLPAGDSASGFFYFEAMPETGDKLYLNGLHETPSGAEIMYFEFPLER
ncbi:MAG: hypothetical protein JO061_09700 [Acidobacteriaceae bacterium]|nr:hypothetical protein [Acidobacteriaceae bacterium]